MDASTPILERVAALHPKRMDLSLGRLERLLAALDHPERRAPPVLHIAGTNGKGSVVAFLRAALEASGRRVHTYTSPHLVRFNERIRLAPAEGGPGQLITDDTLTAVLTEAERVNAGEPITFFEITTAAAFLAFAEHPAEILLLETGLGGRLDATNVIDTPLASVITTIGIDHVGFLGPTLADIAAEKAGIIKRGVPVISAPQKTDAAAVITRSAARAPAPLHLGGEDWGVAEENGRLVFQDEDGLVDLPPPRLVGRHQFTNAGVAIATLRTTGLITTGPALDAGMTDAVWPGRMQRLTKGKIVEAAMPGTEIWLDGGHNEDAGEVAAATLGELEERVSRPVFLIVGMLATKDPVAYFRSFAGLVRHVFTVRVPGHDAAIDAAALADAAEDAGLSAEPVGSVLTALRLFSENWRFEQAPRILMAGSLYLVGDILAQNGTPPT